MNIDAKILKILANQIQTHQKNYLPWSISFIPEMQECFNIFKSINITHYINRQKKKTNKQTHDHLNRFRKGLWQNPTTIPDKSLRETRDTRDSALSFYTYGHLIIDKEIRTKPWRKTSSTNEAIQTGWLHEEDCK